MRSGNRRMGSGEPCRAGSKERRWPMIKRTISSFLVCGSSSFRTPNDMEDYPAELLVNSAKHGKNLKFPRNDSGLSMSSGADQRSIKRENGFSSQRCITASENRAQEVGTSSNVEPSVKGKGLSETRDLVPCHHSVANSRGNGTASTSYHSVNEMVGADANHSIDNMNGNQPHVGEKISNLNDLTSHGHGESISDEVAVEDNLNPINSDSSLGPDSLVDFHTPQEVAPIREQNRQDVSQAQIQVDLVGSNILSGSSGNSAEISSRGVRRNSRSLLWDAFSRRSSRRQDSRTFVFSPDDSDHLRSHDRWLLDFSGDFLINDAGSRTLGSNEHRSSSRSEIWERLRSGHGSMDRLNATCPRGIHSDGSCSCLSSSSTEQYGARAGISRIVMLAEALFEVLDQIHQQPMPLSLSTVSLPAPESIVDSFPVKTYKKREIIDCANDDVTQCYICLSDYEDGDKIRILPCHHEYHMLCVDKWLKEIHGVCPLCRGDVRDACTGAPVSN